MRSRFLCTVILITCSGCAIGDLEFYPDYTRPEVSEEEWDKDPPLNPEIHHYLEQQRLALYKQEPPGLSYLPPHRNKQSSDLAWPSEIAKSLLKNQNIARRISEISRKFEEVGRKPQYYFKTHGLGREQEDRFSAYNSLEDRAEEFMPRFKPNFHILDDVRLHPSAEVEVSDFGLPEGAEGARDGDGENARSREAYKAAELKSNAVQDDNSGRAEEPQQNSFKDVKLVDDPTEFAYPPSDPRYFEDAPPAEAKVPRTADASENSDSQDNENSIQVQHRKDNVYAHHSSPEGARESRHPDDTLEVVAIKPHLGDDTTGVYIIAIVAGISAAATVGLIAFGIGWYNLQKHVKNASDVEYPAYGVTGPNKDISPSGDRRLAQSAQMYHYQHQKQQIIAMERAAASERHGSVSEADSDEENEEGDYTVYECPGLAPTGEMEVKNPLFQDDPTPAQTPALKADEGAQKK